jgi:hypothetical protein
VHTACGSLLLGVETPGRLAEIASASEIRRAVPEIFDLTLTRRPGDRVAAHVHGGAAIGQALFTIPADATYEDVVSRVRDAAGARVEPGSND